MKIAVSSYSFQQYLKDGRLTQFDCVAKAKEMGFDAIEFTDLEPPQGVTEEDYAKQIRQECERVGLVVSNYTVHADFLANDPAEEAQRLMKKVDVAEILGSTSMRHDAAWGFGDHRDGQGLENVLDRLADGCRMVTEYAAGKGIRTMVENHGFFLQDADRVERLINRVNHPNFGWLCDMGNFLCADQDPTQSCGKAAPYVFYAHAKDFIVKSGNEPNPGEGFFASRAGNYLRGTIVGHGAVPVKQCLSILKREGYDGYLGLEFEGIEDCLMGIRIGLDNLKRFLKELEQ
ncbi:MAG: sugar phosphate isomerase/epimerase family protein [Massiliimalia sp.]|jgi:sugar phosphate isomerase/epimerase